MVFTKVGRSLEEQRRIDEYVGAALHKEMPQSQISAISSRRRQNVLFWKVIASPEELERVAGLSSLGAVGFDLVVE